MTQSKERSSLHSSKHSVEQKDGPLVPPQSGRSMLLGRTGSGKSTLLSLLMKQFLLIYRDSRVLIIDSKPRFKATWEVNGTRAAGHYKNWSRGEHVPGSFRLDQDENIKEQLDAVWRSKGRVAIAQTVPGRISDLAWLEYCATIFYGEYSDRIPRLILVDELADFYEISRRSGTGIFTQAARSGRELNIALLAASQRPSYIPTVTMTESDRLYLFQLDYEEDMKKVYAMGVPKNVAVPTVDHSFFYWNKFERFTGPSGRYYKLGGVGD